MVKFHALADRDTAWETCKPYCIAVHKLQSLLNQFQNIRPLPRLQTFHFILRFDHHDAEVIENLREGHTVILEYFDTKLNWFHYFDRFIQI